MYAGENRRWLRMVLQGEAVPCLWQMKGKAGDGLISKTGENIQFHRKYAGSLDGRQILDLREIVTRAHNPGRLEKSQVVTERVLRGFEPALCILSSQHRVRLMIGKENEDTVSRGKEMPSLSLTSLDVPASRLKRTSVTGSRCGKATTLDCSSGASMVAGDTRPQLLSRTDILWQEIGLEVKTVRRLLGYCFIILSNSFPVASTEYRQVQRMSHTLEKLRLALDHAVWDLYERRMAQRDCLHGLIPGEIFYGDHPHFRGPERRLQKRTLKNGKLLRKLTPEEKSYVLTSQARLGELMDCIEHVRYMLLLRDECIKVINQVLYQMRRVLNSSALADISVMDGDNVLPQKGACASK